MAALQSVARPLEAAQRHQMSCASRALRQPLQAQAAGAAAAAAGRWRHQSTLAAPKRQQAARAKPAAAAEEAAAGSDDEEEEEEEEDDEEGIVGELGAADDEEDAWEETEDDMGPQLSTGGTPWGERALEVVQALLAGEAAAAELAGIQLFSFRAIPASKRLDIRLDKLTDQYGSPSLEDVATFSRLFNAAFEAAVGEAAAGEVEIEVSSPGAERQVKVPTELQRFSVLPMRVEYCLDGGDKVEIKVLSFDAYDAAAGITRWRLADVRANRTGGKGRGLNRKQRDTVVELPVGAIRRVNVHLDF